MKYRSDPVNVNLERLLNDLGKYSEDSPEHVQSSIYEVKTFFNAIKSRAACPACGEHKVSVSSHLKMEAVRHYHCLNCGFEFFEDEDELNFSEKAVSEKTVSSRRDSFWNEADRVVVMIAGGGAVGGAIAQLPGAVIGALSAAIYSGYLFFTKKSPAQNS